MDQLTTVLEQSAEGIEKKPTETDSGSSIRTRKFDFSSTRVSPSRQQAPASTTTFSLPPASWKNTATEKSTPEPIPSRTIAPSFGRAPFFIPSWMQQKSKSIIKTPPCRQSVPHKIQSPRQLSASRRAAPSSTDSPHSRKATAAAYAFPTGDDESMPTTAVEAECGGGYLGTSTDSGEGLHFSLVTCYQFNRYHRKISC